MRTLSTLACLLLGASVAAAQGADVQTEGHDPTATPPPSTVGPTPADQLPTPTSTDDPAPPVAEPGSTQTADGVVQQAGIGGEVGYGRAGVLELGGSAGLMLSSGFRNITVAPSVGWFVADNFELTGIFSVSNIKAGDTSATMWSMIAEPSYHIPFNRTTFGFLGMGIGMAYEEKLGAGLAVAPRIGANFLVGRSSILTPSLQYQYITHNNMADGDDATLSLTSALQVNVGYTAMW